MVDSASGTPISGRDVIEKVLNEGVEELTTDGVYHGGGQHLDKHGWPMQPTVGTPNARQTGAIMTISYDDESKSVYDYAFPKHQEENVPGLFFVHTDRVESTSNWGDPVTWDQLREMHNTDPDNGGIQIGNHTTVGSDITKFTHDELVAELEAAQEKLYAEGIRARHFSYPGGANDASSRNIAQRYFDTARNNQAPHETRAVNPMSIGSQPIDSRTVTNVKSDIDTAAANNEWLEVFMHGVHPDGALEGKTVKTPTELQDIIQYAKTNGVTVVTRDEALEQFAPSVFYQARDGSAMQVRRHGPTHFDGLAPAPMLSPDTQQHFQKVQVSSSTVSSGAYETVLDVATPVRVISGNIVGQRPRNLEITFGDGSTFNPVTTSPIYGTDGAGNEIGDVAVPPAEDVTKIRFEHPAIGSSGEYGYHVLFVQDGDAF